MAKVTIRLGVGVLAAFAIGLSYAGVAQASSVQVDTTNHSYSSGDDQGDSSIASTAQVEISQSGSAHGSSVIDQVSNTENLSTGSQTSLEVATKEQAAGVSNADSQSTFSSQLVPASTIGRSVSSGSDQLGANPLLQSYGAPGIASADKAQFAITTREIAYQLNQYAKASHGFDLAGNPNVPIAAPSGSAPQSPSVPVGPLGILQDLTAAMATTSVATIAFLVDHLPLALAYGGLALAVVIVVVATALTIPLIGSLYIRYLQQSGFAHAARSNSVAVISMFFVTPLKMSFIGTRVI